MSGPVIDLRVLNWQDTFHGLDAATDGKGGFMRSRTLLLMTVLIALSACDGSRERQPGAGEAAKEGEAAATSGEYRPPPDPAQLDACALLPASEIPERFGKVTE